MYVIFGELWLECFSDNMDDMDEFRRLIVVQNTHKCVFNLIIIFGKQCTATNLLDHSLNSTRLPTSSQTTMPICTTCAQYVPYLYTVYQSAHNLRLEQCVSTWSFFISLLSWHVCNLENSRTAKTLRIPMSNTTPWLFCWTLSFLRGTSSGIFCTIAVTLRATLRNRQMRNPR